MAQYISLDDLLKEIDNLVDKGNYKDVYDRFFARGINSALDTLKERINTLEVREIDLEKELSYEDYKSFFEKYPNLSEDWGFDESWIFAKYFFELGLKAQIMTSKLHQRISVLKMEFWTGLQTFENSEMTLSDAYNQGINDILEELGIKTQKGEEV